MLTKTSRYFIVLALLSVSTPSLYAQTADNETVNASIIHHGIFAHSPDNGNTWINPISDQTINATSASPVHLKTTREIPARYPLFFGFEYQLSNITEKTVTIETIVSHPPISQPDGNTTTGYQQSMPFLVLDGKVTAITGFLLEQPEETTPGKWTFEITYENKTLLKQAFTVGHPANASSY